LYCKKQLWLLLRWMLPMAGLGVAATRHAFAGSASRIHCHKTQLNAGILPAAGRAVGAVSAK